LVIDKGYLRSRIGEARESLKEIDRIVKKPYTILTGDERYSLRYQIIVLVEAIGSACLHMAIEGFNYEPESYSDCIKYLGRSEVLTYVEDIIKVVRLRNLLVHRYWIIDDLKVYESAKKNFQKIEDFLRDVESRYGL